MWVLEVTKRIHQIDRGGVMKKGECNSMGNIRTARQLAGTVMVAQIGRQSIPVVKSEDGTI